jgi:hypothetical protein
MAWYDLFEYENSADTYIRFEEQRRKDAEKQQRIKDYRNQYGLDEYIRGGSYGSQEQPTYGVDSMKTRDEYSYNKDTFFKNLKEPDFSKTEKIKTEKPKASFGTHLMIMQATPLPKPMKVYKYKTINIEDGAEVITPQKEIEVCGENEHNFYYLTKDGVKSVAKNECSLQKIDPDQLKEMYQTQMNKLAKKIVQSDIGKAVFKPAPEKTNMQKTKEAINWAGKQASEAGMTALAAAGEKLMAPFTWVGDRLIESGGKTTYATDKEYYEPVEIQLKNGVPDKEALKKIDKKTKMVEKITPWKRTKMLFGSIVELIEKSTEGYGSFTTAGKMEKFGRKKEGKPLKDEPYKREYNYPPGFSKETDALMQGKSKEEVAAAREEDSKRFINAVLDRPLDTKLDKSETVGRVAGEMGALVAEIMISHKITSGSSAKGIMKRLLDAGTSGSIIGFMDKLRERDAEVVDTIRNMAKESAFFFAGGEASEKLGGLVKGKSLGKKLLKGGLESVGFGAGGTLGSWPFKDEDERKLGNSVKEMAFMIGVDVGLKILTRGPGAISKALVEKLTKKAEGKFNAKFAEKDITKLIETKPKKLEPTETLAKKLESKAAATKSSRVMTAEEAKASKIFAKTGVEGTATKRIAKKAEEKIETKATETLAKKLESKAAATKSSRVMTAEEVKKAGLVSKTGVKRADLYPKKLEPKAKAEKSIRTESQKKRISKVIEAKESKALSRTEFEKKYKLDTPIKKIPVKERTAEANKRYKKLVNDIGGEIVKREGTKDIKQIFESYDKKYKLTGEGQKVNIKYTLSGDSRYARLETRGKTTNILLNPEKSIYEQVAGLRHEIEHMLDKRAGYTKVTKKVTGAKTIADYMSKPGHHQKYKNFEIEYLQNIYNKESGTKPIENVLAQKEEMSAYGTGTKFSKQKIKKTNNQNFTEATNLPVYIEPKKTLGQKVKDKFKQLYTTGVNNRHGLDATGKYVKYTSQNYTRHHATAEYITIKKMVGRDGKPIGKSVKDIVMAPKGLQAEWESYLLHLNHMAGLKQGKPVLGAPGGGALPGSKTKEAIKKYETMYPEFKKQVKEVQQFFQDFGQEWLVDGGIITQKEFDSMRFLNKNYVPKYRELEKVMSLAKGLHIVGASKGIKKSVGGVDQLKPLTESIPQYVESIVRVVRKNQVHQELANAIANNPIEMQKYAEFVDVSKITNKTLKAKISSLLEKGDLDNKVMSLSETLIEDAAIKGRWAVAFDQGKPILMKINDESIWKALKTMHKTEASGIEVLLDAINKNFSNKVKGVTTHYNPLFPIGNICRDVPTGYIYGSNNNPITYTTNLFRAFGNVMKDTLKNFNIGKGSQNELFQQYKGLGGPGSNITKIEEKLAENGWQKAVDTIFSTLNWFGSVTETVPRLAEFKYVMEKGMKKGKYEEQLIQEALYKSGDITVNFSRGGTVSKQVEKVAIYTNAGIQGVDKFVRSMITEGVAKGNFAPIIKAFGVMTVPSLALHWMSSNIFDQDEYRAIPDYVKDNNYVVPVGDQTWLKIPKNREVGFIFSTVFERMLRYLDGEEDAFKNIGDAAKQTMLNSISGYIEGGIFWPTLNIKGGGNKDFFGNSIEPEWMQGTRSKRYITKENTSYISKKAGPLLEKLNLSPAQADYLIDSYLGWIGDVYLSFNERNKDIGLLERAQKITHRTYQEYGQKATSEYYEKLESLDKQINDLEQNSGLYEYKQQLKDMDYSNKEIGERVKNHMSGVYYTLEDLKEERKKLKQDWKERSE